MVTPEKPFNCAVMFPHDGQMMLDNIIVTHEKTLLYFTKDTDTVITAKPLAAA